MSPGGGPDDTDALLARIDRLVDDPTVSPDAARYIPPGDPLPERPVNRGLAFEAAVADLWSVLREVAALRITTVWRALRNR